MEIDGFDYGGQHWTSDPFQVDSNLDGLSDSDEWPEPVGAAPHLDDVANDWDPDADGVPNLWDEDNDGDEVPDSLDLSPFARTAYSETFSLSIQGGGFDGYLYVEIQLQPEDMDHLRYSTGYLDWPHDERGQLQDLDDSTEDIRLLPILRIHTNQAPDRDLPRNESVTVFEGDGDYVLYVTPMPVSDGGRMVAFYATMAYRPDQLDDIRWEKVELVWMVQMSIDREAGDEIDTSVILLHPYLEESFRVTGLQTTKSRNYESSILGTPDSAEEDRWLFNLLFGLSNTFLTHQDPDLQEIEHRFTSPNTPIEKTWGVPVDKVSMDLPDDPYGHSDEGLTDLPTRIRNFLDVHAYPTDSTLSLVIATQDEMGLYGLDDQGKLETEAHFNLNLNNVSMSTMRGLKSNTYQYEDDAWVSLDLDETLDVMQERYEDELSDIVEDLQDDYPDLTEGDLQLLLDMFYTAWFVGQTRIISIDGQPLAPESRSDADVYDELNHDEDTVPAYLIEAAHLGQPGAGLRVGDNQAQTYTYQREQEGKGNTSGFIPANLIVLGTNVIRVVKTFLSMKTTLQAVRFAKATGSFTGRMRIFSNNAGAGARKLGLIGAIVGIASLWTMFFVTAYGTGWDWDSPAVKFAAAYAAVATVITVIMFLISLNPIGTIVVGILSLLDLICFAATWLFTGEGFSFMNWVISEIAEAFYSVDVLTKLGSMDFVNWDTALMDEELGLIVGNRFRFSAEFVGEIWRTSEGTNKDVEDSYVDAALRGSATGAEWVNKTGHRSCTRLWGTLTCRNDVAVEWALNTVKRNLKLTAKSSIDAKTFYQECTLGICSRKTQYIALPDDLEDEDSWKPIDLYVDVLPDNIHDLWNWSDLINPDRDGDGLSNDEEGSLNTDPDNWDTDGDGLADKLEYDSQEDLGTDPTKADTDGDGLSDGLEYRIGTEINNQDSDDDGLKDGEEVFHLDAGGDWVGGWAVTLPSRVEWVFSNPLVADADGDGLNDRSERNQLASPYAYNDAPHLTLEGDPLAKSPHGAVGVYVALDNAVTMHLTLDNTGPRAVTSTLTLCLPDFLTDLQYDGAMSGDRNPPTQAVASCNGSQWSFAATQHTLLEHEMVSTTVTATVAGLIVSASEEVTATLPFRVGDEDEEEDITDQFTVIVDLEDPDATITAPSDGALLGGGISNYVIGGSASDETSWVTLVEVNLPNEGWVEAEGISPWAYTWELPDDGQYTLQARARDYLEREGSSGTVNVMIDNTPPSVTLDLEDGQIVTSQSTDVISITLEGDASDNLSGLTRVQVSTDGRPWREVGQVANLTYATWSTEWILPNEETAQGEHTVDVRAIDRAGNRSDALRRTIIVDVVPPTSELTDRTYLQDPPPHVAANQQLDLYGVANDAGRVPQPARPMDLVGELDGLDDATIWLELSSVTDDDDGVSVAWIGDFNADRLGDLVMGLPAAEGGKGEVTVVYGRAGGWPTPTDAEVLADSPTSFVGKGGAGIGDALAPAGDVNGDGFSDLLIGDEANDRVFLVFGQPGPLGRDVALDGPRSSYWSVIDLTGLGNLSGLATAGDVDGDGFDDLLIGATDAYLLLGQADPWWETVPLDERAVAVITDTSGALLAGVGDMDGDEYDEFVVVDGDTVYLFEGRDSFAAGAGEPNEALTLADDAIATFASSEVGPEVAALGDVNGDNLADFIYADGDEPKVVFGDANRNWPTQALDFTPAPSGFLAAPGDVDYDGLGDILVGNADGDAYLILGKDLSEVKATLTDVKASASAPYAAGADLNSDGSSDLLLVPAELGVSSVLGYGKMSHIDPDDLPVSQTARSSDFSRSERLESLLQTHHYVNDDGTCGGSTPCYASIQAAVDAAGDGDTINVQPGVYGSVTIDGVDSLTISGVHPDAVFVDGDGSAFAVKIQNATGVKLEKLTLRNADDAVYLDDAGVGGYENQPLITNLQYLLIYDFASHAVAMDRVSSVKLTRCTLAGGDDHLHLYGDPDPAMDASWSTVSTDSRTATSADGGIFVDSDEVYFVDGSGQMDAYNPDTGAWSSLAEAPTGLHAAITMDESGHLWALREDPDSGFDGTVYAIAYVSASEIYVGGDFRHAGSVEAPYMAQWDGSQWQRLTDRGFAPDDTVHAIQVDGDRIYAGGTFGLRYLPAPTVTEPQPTWENWGEISGGGAVYAMAVYGNDVWVGGSFDDIGGIPAHKIAKRQSDGAWKLSGEGNARCNGVRGSHVSALVKKDDRLILGGHFSGVERSFYNPKCYVSDEVNLARLWWGSAGNASKLQETDINDTGHVYALAAAGDNVNVVVGGDFYSVWCQEDEQGRGWCGGSGRARNLGILESDGDWSVPDYLKTNAPPVRALQVVGNQLYIGGDFTQVGESTAADRVAYYDNFPGGGGA
ncbi:MAG: FG-GAP repeat protein [Chloroflexi bacterium]|nr:FG-GAP repeat protein [Chloroflexota bacterium]